MGLPLGGITTRLSSNRFGYIQVYRMPNFLSSRGFLLSAISIGSHPRSENRNGDCTSRCRLAMDHGGRVPSQTPLPAPGNCRTCRSLPIHPCSSQREHQISLHWRGTCRASWGALITPRRPQNLLKKNHPESSVRQWPPLKTAAGD